MPSAPILVQVLDARRATPDTVLITIRFISQAAASVALFPDGTDPGDFCLTTSDGARRLFLLRDAQNQPVVDGSLAPLSAGQRRVVQLSFPAPPAAQSGKVTLHLGPLSLANLPISK